MNIKWHETANLFRQLQYHTDVFIGSNFISHFIKLKWGRNRAIAAVKVLLPMIGLISKTTDYRVIITDLDVPSTNKLIVISSDSSLAFIKRKVLTRSFKCLL